MNQSLVFNIQKYSVHDGPGIRTIVFLKGCPLHCPWCSNPEGKSYKAELQFSENLCKKCGRCVRQCPQSAITLDESIKIDREKCKLCEKCVDTCLEMAFKVVGDSKDIDKILKQVSRDEIFYKRSGGGITLSGGDPLSHGEFALELLRKAKEDYSLSTAIETTGFTSEEMLRKALKYVDFVFCDLKTMDPQKHKVALGVPNDVILKNIRIIANEYKDKEFILRTPLIPNFNDDDNNIEEMASFINSLERKISLELLPYHMFGKAKYTALGYDYDEVMANTQPPSASHVQKIIDKLKKLGVDVINQASGDDTKSGEPSKASASIDNVRDESLDITKEVSGEKAAKYKEALDKTLAKAHQA